MLELRPNCENCNKPLPPDTLEAMICTYECTFCRECVEDVLENVCPNCGGGFCPRPIRPKNNLKNGNHLGRDPAGSQAVWKPVDPAEHQRFIGGIVNIPPERR